MNIAIRIMVSAVTIIVFALAGCDFTAGEMGSVVAAPEVAELNTVPYCPTGGVSWLPWYVCKDVELTSQDFSDIKIDYHRSTINDLDLAVDLVCDSEFGCKNPWNVVVSVARWDDATSSWGPYQVLHTDEYDTDNTFYQNIISSVDYNDRVRLEVYKLVVPCNGCGNGWGGDEIHVNVNSYPGF